MRLRDLTQKCIEEIAGAKSRALEKFLEMGLQVRRVKRIVILMLRVFLIISMRL